MNEQQTDRLERLIGLEMDRRLTGEQASELARALSESAQARELKAAMLGARAALLAVPEPEVPAGLRAGIESRVALVRARIGEEARILPFCRRLVLAAAILLCVSLFTLSGGVSNFTDPGVKAGSPGAAETPSVEDEIRDHDAGDGTLRGYLRWRFLRSES
ncbi:MAG: hypothetical protein V2A76_00170 [Planctomycetota bacterium]